MEARQYQQGKESSMWGFGGTESHPGQKKHTEMKRNENGDKENKVGLHLP